MGNIKISMHEEHNKAQYSSCYGHFSFITRAIIMSIEHFHSSGRWPVAMQFYWDTFTYKKKTKQTGPPTWPQHYSPLQKL